MGNTGLLKWEAKMTLLQPHPEESRQQELRNSPVWPTPLFKLQLEAIFDLIPGDEGFETPLPNDSSIASISPPVGGCLRYFRRDWLTNKCSDNMLNIII